MAGHTRRAETRERRVEGVWGLHGLPPLSRNYFLTKGIEHPFLSGLSRVLSGNIVVWAVELRLGTTVTSFRSPHRTSEEHGYPYMRCGVLWGAMSLAYWRSWPTKTLRTSRRMKSCVGSSRVCC